MQPRIIDINEVKCNFCFNWINGPTLHKTGVNSCMTCLNKYLKSKCLVNTPDGDIYVLRFVKRVKWSHSTQHQQKQNIVHEVAEDNNDSFDKKNQEKQMSQKDQCKSVKSQIFDIKISQIQNKTNNQAQNFTDFVKMMNSVISKSQLINREQSDTNKPSQSCIFNTPIKQKDKYDFYSMKKLERLQDYGRSLDKTRFVEKYQFYHDHNVIQSFIEEHPKIQQRSYRSKQFGNQISSNDIENSMTYRSKGAHSKSHRSQFSNDSQSRIPKLQGEQIKQKISGFLQTKYTSESLTRIMTTYLRQAYDTTNLQNRTLQLINFKISNIDLYCYLNMFDFEHIQIIKLINVALTDEQVPILLNFIWNKPVESLVLTGNKLTENCLSVFLNKSLPFLKQLYLGNNRITKSKLKQNIAELHSKFILYL